MKVEIFKSAWPRDFSEDLSLGLEIVDQPGVDIFGQVFNQWKNKECVCPNCNRSIAASRFAPHLEKCMGMGRNSSRIANRRYVFKGVGVCVFVIYVCGVCV